MNTIEEQAEKYAVGFIGVFKKEITNAFLAGAEATKRVEWVEGNRPEKAGWYAVTLKDGGSIYDRYDRYDWHIAHIGIVVAYARIDPPAPFVKDGKNGRD